MKEKLKSNTIQERISQLIEIGEDTVYGFARKCEIPETTLNVILKGKKGKDGNRYYPNPNFEVIVNIMKHGAPKGEKLRSEWLLLGIGEPFVPKEAPEKDEIISMLKEQQSKAREDLEYYKEALKNCELTTRILQEYIMDLKQKIKDKNENSVNGK